MNLATFPWHPPLYVSVIVLITTLFPFAAVRPLSRLPARDWVAAPLLISLPVTCNAAVSFLQLRGTIAGLAIVGHPVVAAAAAGVGDAQSPLKIGTASAVVTALIGVWFVTRARHRQDGVPTTPLLRMTSLVLAALSAAAAAAVLLASVLVANSSLANLGRLYDFLSSAAIVCTTLLVVTVVHLLLVARFRGVPLPETRHWTKAHLVSLGSSAAVAVLLGTSASLLQQHYFHIAMYGAG